MKKTEIFAETIGRLFITVAILIMAILVSFYKIWIIMKLTLWFSVPVNFTLPQWYGIMAIYALFTFSLEDEKPKNTLTEQFIKVLKRAFFWTLILGLDYLIKLVIT